MASSAAELLTDLTKKYKDGHLRSLLFTFLILNISRDYPYLFQMLLLKFQHVYTLVQWFPK